MAESVVNAVANRLAGACQEIQNEFAEELKKTVRIAADTINLEHRAYTNSHGVERVKETQDWVRSVQQAIDDSNKTFKPEMNDAVITIRAGLGDAVEPYVKERSLVIQEGNTDEDGTLLTKPGQEVWNHDLSGRELSKSKSAHDVLGYMKILPEEGQYYIEDAAQNMEHKAKDILQNALASFIPQAFAATLNNMAIHSSVDHRNNYDAPDAFTDWGYVPDDTIDWDSFI